MKRFLVVVGIVFSSTTIGAWAQALSDSDIAYVRQVVAENAQKTNARLITLHVKSTHEASSSELTDAQSSPDRVFDLRREYTVVVGESDGMVFRFLTDDDRVGKVQVGKDYLVVLGMAALDLKKHRYNVKDRNSAVILLPNIDQQKEPGQFSMTIVEIAEK